MNRNITGIFQFYSVKDGAHFHCYVQVEWLTFRAWQCRVDARYKFGHEFGVTSQAQAPCLPQGPSSFLSLSNSRYLVFCRTTFVPFRKSERVSNRAAKQRDHHHNTRRMQKGCSLDQTVRRDDPYGIASRNRRYTCRTVWNPRHPPALSSWTL